MNGLTENLMTSCVPVVSKTSVRPITNDCQLIEMIKIVHKRNSRLLKQFLETTPDSLDKGYNVTGYTLHSFVDRIILVNENENLQQTNDYLLNRQFSHNSCDDVILQVDGCEVNVQKITNIIDHHVEPKQIFSDDDLSNHPIHPRIIAQRIDRILELPRFQMASNHDIHYQLVEE